MWCSKETLVLKMQLKWFCLGLWEMGSLGWGRIQHKIGNGFNIIKMSNLSSASKGGFQVFCISLVVLCLVDSLEYKKEPYWSNLIKSRLVFLKSPLSNLVMNNNSLLLNQVFALYPDIHICLMFYPWIITWACSSSYSPEVTLCCSKIIYLQPLAR